MERRTLIRLLVAFSIGVPVGIELLTLGGMFGRGPFSRRSPSRNTPSPEGVGVGDELLPETPQRETLTAAAIRDGGDWQLTMTIDVENPTDNPYVLRLGPVTLDSGRSVDGGGTSGRIPPGSARAVTGRWSLPAGSTPRAVDVLTATYANSTTSSPPSRRTVRLAKITVRGS